MSSGKPKVSVCMPNYNFGDFIGQAIQSVLEQTFTDFELIIIDDASTDNSKSVIKSFPDERVKFYQNERNLGEISFSKGPKRSRRRISPRSRLPLLCGGPNRVLWSGRLPASGIFVQPSSTTFMSISRARWCMLSMWSP